MSYNASMRVWRGDQDCGALQDFTVEVNEGEVVLDATTVCNRPKRPTSRSAGIVKRASADRARQESTATRT